MKSIFKYIIVGAICAVVGCTATALYKDISYISMGNDTIEQSFVKKLAMINYNLSEQYIYDYDKQKMYDNALKGYIWGLEEDYTNYYTKDEFESYMTSIEETYVGIGVVVSPNEDGFIEIISAFKGSSAYNAGIKPGDILFKIEGQQYYSEQMDEAIAKIKNGKEGTNVNITILRDNEEIEMDILRSVVSLNSVESEMIDGDIGYICINSFNSRGEASKDDTYTEFCNNLTTLQNNGAKKLIIDLRDNPGGGLEVVVNIADYLLPEGLIMYTEYKDGTKEEYKSDKNEVDMPIVVLINEHSASASEVLTGALKDHNKATVVGKTSYGKGVVQTLYPFWDGSGMSITVAKYYCPNGECIHEKGIEPDVYVELDKKYDNFYAADVPKEDDLQLKKAIELLK